MVSHCKSEASALSWAETGYPVYLPLARLKAAPFISVLACWPSRSKLDQREKAGSQSVVRPPGVILLPGIVLLN